MLAQQGANTPGRNATARVRLAAAVSGNAVVSASAASTAVATSVVAPSVTGYAVVPAGTPLNITVNGATVASPVTALAAGGDSTLFVYGSPSTATASLITDDNRLPSSTTSLKLRMVNGLTGAATPLTLNAAFTVIASDIAPGAASSYTVLSAATPVQLDVFTPSSPTPIYSTTTHRHRCAAQPAGQLGLHAVHAGGCFDTDRLAAQGPLRSAAGRRLAVRFLAYRRATRVRLGKRRQAPGDRHLN